MTAAEVIDALDLPGAARLDRRVPKKLLIENGTPTSADKRRINEGIEEIIWVAALKPATIGVPAYRDDVREYLEIAVLSLVFREAAKAARLVELVHRAIPYPVLLVSAHRDTISVSAAHKRQAQNEAQKVVLDGTVVEVAVPATAPVIEMLRVAAQPKQNLLRFYQGWFDGIEAIQAGQITGSYRRAFDECQAAARRLALAEHGRIVREIAELRSRAQRAVQIQRRVELNLAIQRLQQELSETDQRL